MALFFAVSYNAQTDQKVYEQVDQQAEFVGGLKEMANYIQKELHYPQTAKDKKVGGKVFVKFVVTKDGLVQNAQVLKGVEDCVECDAEALRVISSMPKWTPAKKDGKTVNCYYNIPIKFDPA